MSGYGFGHAGPDPGMNETGTGNGAVFPRIPPGQASSGSGLFAPAELPRIFDHLHAHGVQGFVTFNTLVFDKELPVAEGALADIARAGADAIIVQDLGAARLARAVCPELPLHASTQMTVSSAEAAEIARALGGTRVVLPRELQVGEIALLASAPDLELAVVVHS